MEAIQQKIYDNYREYFDWKPRNVSDSVKYHRVTQSLHSGFRVIH